MKIKLMPMLGGLIALSVVASPFIVKAQAQTTDQSAPTQITPKNGFGKWKKLNLTDAQKAQLKTIHEETRTLIKGVLNSEQQAKLQTMMQERQSRIRQGGQAFQGRQNRWTSLNLTDDQKAKIKAIKDAQKPKMIAVFTPEQQQQIQQMRQEWQQMRQQRQQQNTNQ